MCKQFYFLLLVILFSACSAPQEPIFKNISNIRSTNISTKKITITAAAIYHNPNSVGGELSAIDIAVDVNGINTAKIVQDVAIKVPAQSEFSVPLTFDAAPLDIFENNRNGVIGGILNAALSRKVNLHYRGEVRMKIAGIPYTLPIDYEEEVKL
jgi:LEA14-like dessication related protein